jgi:hypothetical protein
VLKHHVRKQYVSVEEYLYIFLATALISTSGQIDIPAVLHPERKLLLPIQHRVNELQSLRTVDLVEQEAYAETTRELRSEQIKMWSNIFLRRCIPATD